MIPQFVAFITAFKQGKELANAATWKNAQLATGALASLLGAAVVIAQGFGIDVHVSDAALQAAAAGVVALYGLFNAVATAVSSAKVGLPAKPPALGSTGSGSSTSARPAEDHAGG